MERVDARQRAYELLDKADAARGRAVRCYEMAMNLYREDGDMVEARGLFRGGLMRRDADYGAIYRGWIAMEADHAGDVDAARALFPEWLLRVRADRSGDDGGFWCSYVSFEARHGGDARARNVAEEAVAACPDEPALHAKLAKLELRLGQEERALAVLRRALDAFASDAAAQEWLVDEVHGYRDALLRRSLAGRIRLCCRGVRRRCLSLRRRHGYERLRSV